MVLLLCAVCLDVLRCDVAGLAVLENRTDQSTAKINQHMLRLGVCIFWSITQGKHTRLLAQKYLKDRKLIRFKNSNYHKQVEHHYQYAHKNYFSTSSMHCAYHKQSHLTIPLHA